MAGSPRLLLRRWVVLLKRELIQRVRGGMQVAVREMQIDGGVFQVRMAQEQLNGPQIGPRFHVVGSKTVAQRGRCDFFLKARPLGSPFADVPNGLVGDGLFLAAMAGAAAIPGTVRGSQPPDLG